MLKTLLRAVPLVAALLLCGAAEARITRIVVDQRAPAFNGTEIGDSGAYERLTGRLFGEVDPTDARNALIQDIGLAPRNAAGHVEYVATFTILKPVELNRGNGVMLYQVSNRGGRVEPTADTAVPGATYVWTGWQGDLLARPCTGDYPCTKLTHPVTGGQEVLSVPVARNADGTPITGPVYGSVFDASGSTAQLVLTTTPIPYRPATLDTTQAHFAKVTKQTVDGQVRDSTEISSDDWAWADCRKTPFPGTPDPTRICLKDGFDPKFEYDMSFIAKDPLVLGLGFAATRDAVSFFRGAVQDDAGTANPLASAISHAIAQGASQAGNFLRSLIYWGFNEDESGKRVFEGVFPTGAGRQLDLNMRFALPDAIQTLYMPGTEAPVWWSAWADTAHGRDAAGLLDSCTVTNTCPKIFESFGSLEFWALKMSADIVGPTATADIPLPDNVRRYYFPGTTHGGGAGGFSAATPPPAGGGACKLPANPNPETEQNAALLDALIAWVVDGTPPPASRYPRLSNGQLVAPTQAATGFPVIPGLTFIDNLVNPLMDLDFGPSFDPAHQTGSATQQPPAITRLFPTLVVKVNSDGNETAGYPSVQYMAPLGTYTGWNVWASGARKGQICNLNGAFLPFKATKAERIAAGDPRPSLQERYGNHDGYVCSVTAATRRAEASRLLRPADAKKLIAQASESDVLRGVLAGEAEDNISRAICRTAGM